jgi:hypothetical protein
LRCAIVSAVVVVICACGHSEDRPVYTDPSIDAAQSCGLVTCASLNATCGQIGDGCGNTAFDCGTCPTGQVCGGGAGTSFTCGENPCRPRTCDDAGATCGRVSDGCGGLTPSCGTCPDGEACGVAGVANRCAVPPCTGLCLQKAACPNQPKTTITGTVTAPGHAQPSPFGPADPIYGALVYIPNGADGAPGYGVKAFTPGVSCDSCSSLVSEPPLASVTTAVDGSFTIADAPCGADIPLVIQLGRWRRQIKIPSVACCAENALTSAQTHLPRTSTGEPGDVRSDIPKIAVSTGAADTLHCVLRKLGVADTEFTNPGGAGRVHLYKDNGAQIDAATPAASTLYGDAAQLSKYDMTLFECVGGREPKASVDQSRVINFANAGGRVFATHFSYVWLTDSDGTPASNTGPRPFSSTASWHVDQAQADSATAFVDTTLQGDPETRARRVAFASWLGLVGASVTPGEVPLVAVRNDLDAVSSVPATAASTPAQRWLYTTSPFAAPVQYTFDTPVAYAPSPKPAKRCGRVLYSDFHVSGAAQVGATFPHECDDGPLTPQEKTLEFLLFDLATCIGPQPSACIPRTCQEQGIECGPAGDGCDDGVVLNCGGCSNGRSCGGGGAGVCGTFECVPRTCADLSLDCGLIGDGCGGTVDCGKCDPGETCGGGDHAPNVCALILK